MHRMLEIVYAIFDNNGYFSDEKENKVPADELFEMDMFPKLHTLGFSRFYFVLSTELHTPLTSWQKRKLDSLKAEKKILDYTVRDVV